MSDEPESRHELIVGELSNKSDAELRELVKEEIATLPCDRCVASLLVTVWQNGEAS